MSVTRECLQKRAKVSPALRGLLAVLVTLPVTG